MPSNLDEVRAREIVRTMQALRRNVDAFATHAKLLSASSASFDGLPLLGEADQLLRVLKANRSAFEEASANIKSLKRSLSAYAPVGGGMPPAAKWGNEFRAGSKQFIEAVARAEREIGRLYAAANQKMNSPTRMSTAPENLLDIALNFADALARWVEYRRRQKH